MPSNISPIAPLVTAQIRAHGAQTRESLSRVIPYNAGSIGKVLMNMADRGEIIVVRQENLGHGSRRNWYGLTETHEFPHIGCSEYIGYWVTGSRPEDMRRVAP